jgi:hypothetical protein
MYNNEFKYAPPIIDLKLTKHFEGTSQEKKELFSIVDEWNRRTSISNLCTYWEKQRPLSSSPENIFFLLYNCECLRTHQADLDLLLSSYLPQVVILIGVRSLIHKLPLLPNHY